MLSKATPTIKLPVNVAAIRDRLGARRTHDVEAILEPYVVVQSRTTDEPVTGQVVIESIERGVTVVGSVSYAWEADCRRCLEIVRRRHEVEIDEIFQIDAQGNSDLIPFDGQQIDLLPVVRDAVVLSLPLAPLCSDGCSGPDPARYPAKPVGQHDENGAEPKVDPRWTALDELNLADN